MQNGATYRFSTHCCVDRKKSFESRSSLPRHGFRSNPSGSLVLSQGWAAKSRWRLGWTEELRALSYLARDVNVSNDESGSWHGAWASTRSFAVSSKHGSLSLFEGDAEMACFECVWRAMVRAQAQLTMLFVEMAAAIPPG